MARLPGLRGPDRAACPQGCDRAFDHAILTANLTAKEKRDPVLPAKFDAVAERMSAG